MTMENDLVERLLENTEMLQDGLQKGLTEAWHTVVMKQAAKDSTEAAACIAEQQAQVTALQAERSSLIATKREQLAAKDARIQVLEAELARKTEALPDLSSVISWLENGCDPKNGAKELRIYAARIAAALEEKTDV